MADPRGNMTYKCQAAAIQQQSSMRAFGNAVGKVGDLQVLNSIGGGAIGQGLRTIASVSNSIRSGNGSLPTSIGSSTDAGASWVLDQTGIGSATVQAVGSLNPGIANQAWGQAQQIFQKTKQGQFKTTDIPYYMQDLQNLERLGRNIFTPNNVQGGMSVSCVNSPYAMDLIARAPKHKFMFVVQFIFENGYTDLSTNEMAFVVKKSTRPNIKFQTEDVNYYNFRSKVITRTEFEEMSMTFHDDIRNQSLAFYNAYRNALSPITNLGDGYGLAADPENNGMDFMGGINQTAINNGTGTIKTNAYSASRGPLLNSGSDVKNILKTIRLFHIYDAGRKMNVYQFLNPRIAQMQLDEVNMAISEGSEVTIAFNYDSVYINQGIDSNDSSFTDDANALPGQQIGVLYPLRYNGTAGAMNTSHALKPPVSGVSLVGNLLNGISTGLSPSSLDGGVSGLINSTVLQATSLTSSLTGDNASGIIDSVTNQASGAIGSIAPMAEQAAGALSGTANSVASQATGAVNDIVSGLL